MNRAFTRDVTNTKVAILVNKCCTLALVILAVLGSSNRSGRDKVSFFRIPKSRKAARQRVMDLSKARRRFIPRGLR